MCLKLRRHIQARYGMESPQSQSQWLVTPGPCCRDMALTDTRSFLRVTPVRLALFHCLWPGAESHPWHFDCLMIEEAHLDLCSWYFWATEMGEKQLLLFLGNGGKTSIRETELCYQRCTSARGLGQMPQNQSLVPTGSNCPTLGPSRAHYSVGLLFIPFTALWN